ncbi:OLC1v1003711C1 [Oldenlandia corymbosa var. corymbosa]|uniref:OLC1v1003711C1 n=1 Tax=Oldenlandia corymbosa var. corymbosa TaxID=529605 RepID=A0AAV1DD06_OLDCO|nr:OLC1v1003711C1 [Oldenlandia corymbosa var. corymbosa]
MDLKEATPSSPAIATDNSSEAAAKEVVEEDEEEGFVSGEEEFEVAPEKPPIADVDDKAGAKVGESPISLKDDGVIDDDEKGASKDEVLVGGKEAVLVGDKVEGDEEPAAVPSGGGLSGDKAVGPAENGVIPGSDGDFDGNSGGSGEGIVQNEKGPVEGEKSAEGDNVVEAINVDVKVTEPGVAVVGDTSALIDEHTEVQGDEKIENVVEEEGKPGGKDDDKIEDGVEGEGKPGEKGGLEVVTPEGDSTVEAINVDASATEPSVAFVRETALQNEPPSSESEDHPAADMGDRKSVIVEEDEGQPDEEGDAVVEAINVDVSVVEPGVAVVGEVATKDREVEVPGSEDHTLVDASNVANGFQTLNQEDIDGPPGTESELSNVNKGKGAVSDNYENVVEGDENLVDDELAVVGTQNEGRDGGDEAKIQFGEVDDFDEGSLSDGEMIFGSSEAAKQFIEELERGSASADGSRDPRIDGQIATDSEEDVDTDEEGEGKELFDSAALAALLKAATGADPDGGGNITITSQDGSRLFSVERPAGLGSSIRPFRSAVHQQPRRPNIFAPSALSNNGDSDSNLSDEEKKKLEKLQQIRVKFLRLVHRLGLSPEESVAAQVLYRMSIVAGRQTGQIFNAEAAKTRAMELEAEGKEDLDFSLNILVLGKCGVGKSSTINAVFGEKKAEIDAFQPGTGTVREFTGVVDGVKIRIYDTPGLKTSVMEQSFNRSILSSVKKFTKKNPPDIILYVDRLDAQTRDLNDLPLLRTITSVLGTSIWRNAIVTLTHAASAPPDGPTGSPLSYEVFVTQRSHVVQQSIGQAVGDLRMMTPSMMNPVSLIENHPSCRKNREGHKVLPNGQTWRPQLLLLCYSMKILSEASSLSKPQDPFDHRRLFGFRGRSPPLPYMLSSMLQSRQHPKLPSEQGVDSVDSDVDLDDLSDVENDEEDEYDQLPPFKPLRKAQIAKLDKEQKKAYFEEFDYRVKLLQKKQWKEELRRIKMMKTKGKDIGVEYGLAEEDADSGAAAPVAVPLPDMVLPPSFDSDNPGYRYRFLEPTSQFLARPVLDTHGWDHDCGYDGVNVEHSLAIANQFPAALTFQITKDKKDFSISLDSSVSTKHGENGSSMAGFDIQSIGKQLAYVVRGETKFKNLKKNKTAGGISVTFLGENVVPGLKLEDQITLGKQYVLVGSAGAVRSQNDTALGANFELQRRENDFPIGQVQSTVSMSVVKWRGDTALGFNGLTQVSIGRNSKIAVRAGINNKMSGQITVRTSNSDNLSLALAALIPTAISIYKKLWPGAVTDKYSLY